jgi:hypothetical protein
VPESNQPEAHQPGWQQKPEPSWLEGAPGDDTHVLNPCLKVGESLRCQCYVCRALSCDCCSVLSLLSLARESEGGEEKASLTSTM